MAALLMAAFAQGTQAQDLSGQRSEKQDVNMIPGKKLDHHGLIVSPTPHLLNVDAANRLDLKNGVKVIDKKGKFADDVKFLTANAKGIRLTIDFGEKLAAKAGVKPVSGAYSLRLMPRVSRLWATTSVVPSTVCRLCARLLTARWQRDRCLTPPATTTQIFQIVVW